MYSRKHVALFTTALFISTIIIITLVSFIKNLGSSPPPLIPTAIEERVSEGENILISQEEINKEIASFRQAKQRGVESFAKQDYSQSENEFRLALQAYQNAPETLIYLNNASIGRAKSYTIAVVGPFSSNPSTLAILRGVALAQQQINQNGGIKGIKLKIKLANDDNEPAVAQELASFLAEDQSVLGVIGHYSSSVTLAAKEIYTSRRLPAISATSTSIDISKTNPGEIRFVFRTVPNDEFSATALARHFLDIWNLRKVAVFFDAESNYSVSLKSEFTEEIVQGQGDIVSEFNFSDPDFDAIQALRTSLSSGAEGLMLAAHSEVFDKAFTIIRRNDGNLKLLGGDELYDFQILTKLGEQAIGMVVPTAWDINADPTSDFAQKSLELWNAKVNWLSAMAYDATQAFIAALKQETSRDGIQKVLMSPDFNAPGASYAVRFTSSGDRQGKVYLMEVQPSDSDTPFPSGAPFDFVQVQPR